PVGICGSGALDIAAQLVVHEIADETGLLCDDYFDDGIEITEDKKIMFTQKDLREIQLAKSAVRSGIEILLAASGFTYESIERVFIAGGFGHKINLDSAQALGIIPAELRPKVCAVGNTSLGGCVMALMGKEARRDIERIAKTATEINLSADPRFNNLFMQHMMFN
ncbi:MAG: ATP-binding protein, partial [Defluviitaleaceae bacterium]|nr:ATP-binding protein [Defluviitaleaceae bacterium]